MDSMSAIVRVDAEPEGTSRRAAKGTRSRVDKGPKDAGDKAARGQGDRKVKTAVHLSSAAYRRLSLAAVAKEQNQSSLIEELILAGLDQYVLSVRSTAPGFAAGKSAASVALTDRPDDAAEMRQESGTA
jgi:hypothetical protein